MKINYLLEELTNDCRFFFYGLNLSVILKAREALGESQKIIHYLQQIVLNIEDNICH